MDVDSFCERYPVLFHLTNATAWHSIEKHGLLSTKAICEKLGFSDHETLHHLRTPRANSLILNGFIVRDQKPLRLHNLVRNLENSNLSVGDWCALLNERVFFSTKRGFVNRLRSSYIKDPVTIICIDSRELIQRHISDVEISSKNTGAARMPDHFKSRATFQSLSVFVDGPRSRAKELTVQHSVPNIPKILRRVVHLEPLEEVPLFDDLY